MIPGLIAHLWQSTLFAGAAWLLNLALRRNSARVRYAVWFIASAKFLVPFSLLVGLGALVPRHAAAPALQPGWVAMTEQISQPFANIPVVTTRVAEGTRHNYFAAALLVLWACGFAVIAICWLARWKRVHTLRRSATPASIPGGTQFTVPVLSVPGLVEPGVVGILRPVLLLPEGIGEHLDREQLDAILTHELCHVRRRDNLTATIHMVVQAIFWFHPLVWWLGARLVDERERACDEEVLRLGNEPQVYAAGILNICKLYVESPLVCVSGVTGANLKRRIEAIMANRRGMVLNRAKTCLLASCGFVALAGPVALGVMIGVGIPAAIRAQLPATVSELAQTAQPVPDTQPVTPIQSGTPRRPPSAGPSTAERLTFDAVTVRLVEHNATPRSVSGGPGTSDPGRYRRANTPLLQILDIAYDVRNPVVLVAPDWLNAVFVDIEATMPLDTTSEQLREMLRNLLTVRFKLAIHRETREVSTYALVVGKGGPRMSESATTQSREDDSGRNGHESNDAYGLPIIQPSHPGMFGIEGASRKLVAKEQTMGQFADRLGTVMGRPIFDKTNLTAKYDFTLSFANLGVAPQSEEVGGPPEITTAVQEQLGLKLESAKGIVEVIVVDHIEKTPTEN
jgi:uncharacterized protein (TIGR03435 family)